MTRTNDDRAVTVQQAGGPEALEWTAVDTPAPAAGEVRLRQHAIGVNFIDTYFRSGLYPWPTTPLIPGAEAAGVVEDCGVGVTEFAPGDRVAYTVPLGAYRTRRVLAADRLVKLPPQIDFETAASIMLKGLTVQFLVTSCFAVQAGHTVLVHAAAGGVGSLMGQWLKALGAVSIGTVGSAAKAAVARAHGYTHVIDNSAEDFVARTADITGGRGCEVVYDSVGNDTWRGSLKSLKLRGTFVSFGQSSGMISDFKVSDLAGGGSLFATRPMLFDYIKAPEELQMRARDLFARLESGALVAHVGQRMALEQAAEAHRALASRKTVGATVLTT